MYRTSLSFQKIIFCYAPDHLPDGKIGMASSRSRRSEAASISRRITGGSTVRVGLRDRGRTKRDSSREGLRFSTFFCSSGQWRESTHSGIYGHEVNVVNIDLKSCGYSILSASRWLESTPWDFEDYQGIIFFYSRRDLTYEFDKLNAISGCLNLIAAKKKESDSSKACLRWTSTTHCFSTKTVPNAEKASQVGAGQDGLAV